MSACDFGIFCLRLFKCFSDINAFSQHCNRDIVNYFPHFDTEQTH